MKKWVKNMLAGAMASMALAFGTGAFASSIEVTNLSVTGSGPFTYTYSADLTPGNTIKSGDFFVIFDFNGLQGTPTETLTNPGSWTVVVENTTTQAPFQNAPDNPAIKNVKFVYSGTDISSPGSPNTTALQIGSVSLVSTIGPAGVVFYSGQDHDSNNQLAGNTNTTLGPTTAAPLPSTASMGLTMIAACGIAAGAMKLRRKEVTA